MGRSATMATGALTMVESPLPFWPSAPSSAGLTTSMVVRDDGARFLVLTTGVVWPSTEYVMVAGTVPVVGLSRVRYIWKSVWVVPSGKYHVGAGCTAWASWAPSRVTGICEKAPAGCDMYMGRSATIAWSDTSVAPTPVKIPLTPPCPGSKTATVSRVRGAMVRTTWLPGMPHETGVPAGCSHE